MEIPKAEGIMRAEAGDWIVIDEAGEQYRCTPEVFAQTYQPVLDHDSAPAPVAAAPAAPVAEASVHDSSVEEALDTLIARMTALSNGAADDHERGLVLSKLEEARFWLQGRTRRQA